MYFDVLDVWKEKGKKCIHSFNLWTHHVLPTSSDFSYKYRVVDALFFFYSF